MSIRTILHPTDYSELSHAAFRWAVAEAHAHGARLIILHTVESLGPENATYAEVMSERQPAGYRKRLWDELHREQSPDPTVPVEYVLADADPVEAIVQTAIERNCDLIVLGSHGRQGLQRVLEGSIAERVMRTAPCPVVVVKLPKKATHQTVQPGSELHPNSLPDRPSR